MKCDKETMLLYAVTDRAWVGKQSLYEQVEAALKGGVTCVQLREKELVRLLNPETKRGRLYELTEYGVEILNLMKSQN